MLAGGCDCDCTFCHLLITDIFDVYVVRRQLLEYFIEPRWRRLDVQTPLMSGPDEISVLSRSPGPQTVGQLSVVRRAYRVISVTVQIARVQATIGEIPSA